jgi:uncharacterized protein YneF (UPF0154 family)
MQILAGVLILIGFVAGVTALVIGFHIAMFAVKYGTPNNPDWMAVGLRLYKPQVAAFFVLIAAFVAAMVLGTFMAETSWR